MHVFICLYVQVCAGANGDHRKASNPSELELQVAYELPDLQVLRKSSKHSESPLWPLCISYFFVYVFMCLCICLCVYTLVHAVCAWEGQ